MLHQALGLRYFLEPNMKHDIFKVHSDNTNKNPFDEIQKYDLYKWTQSYRVQRTHIEMKLNNLEFPEPDTSRLDIIKSNNYVKVYDTTMKNDIWDTEYCDNNQMGDDASNPNNLDKCIYIDERNQTKLYKNIVNVKKKIC